MQQGSDFVSGPGAATDIIASCGVGEAVLGGGCLGDSPNGWELTAAGPGDLTLAGNQRFRCSYQNQSGGGLDTLGLTAIAVCVQIPAFCIL